MTSDRFAPTRQTCPNRASGRTCRPPTLTETVVDNQDAHNTMADYFFSDGPGAHGVVVALADVFYETAQDTVSLPRGRDEDAPSDPAGLH